MVATPLIKDRNPQNFLSELDELRQRIETLERQAATGLFVGDTMELPGGLSANDVQANGRVTALIRNLSDPVELTIDAGVVGMTQSYHTIEWGDVADADLDEINDGLAGDLLFLRAADSTHTIVCKDGTSNLALEGDFSMDHADDMIVLLYDGTNWLEVSRSNNS